ncbi:MULTISPECIES: flagellin [Petrotoga]|uniref:Flagellin n=4 Tax=Petrotoga TaxID=28236 RepID=A0A4R8EUM9_9BACT|nr:MULTISPECIES: flagellin [Petrotoga]PNR94880.1 flagellin [Petrotoga olearia DSM 13574]POZ87950.1 flagellin [Petrotoga sibirica DSM 13575]RMA73167.1 flagellin [Petrotoga olearia]TDX16109.1 flagellin [Petrotoga sibirica]
MRINHNISALNAWRSMDQVNQSMGKTLEKLSSGLRINRAGDDAAGLAISEKMRGQIKGLDTAVKNAQDSISLIQTAEGALTETHSILQRMRELSVQAASDTNTNVDRNQIQLELDQLRDEIDRISRTTEFNTMKLLDGKIESFRGSEDIKVVTGGNINVEAGLISGSTAVEGTYVVEVGQLSGTETTALDVKITQITAGGQTSTIVTLGAGAATIGGISFKWESSTFAISDFGGSLPKNEIVDSAVVRVEAANTAANQLVLQIGANEGHNIVLGIDDMSSKALGLTEDSLKATDQDSAERSIMVVDAAIHKVSTARASLGAVQNRLEHTISNLGVASENLTAAESRIRDADMAKEMMDFTKQQILLQASNAMLAQANTIPQNVLQLLR